MARDTKPGKSGAVRPTVIEGKAKEVNKKTGKPAQQASGGKPASDNKPAGDKVKTDKKPAADGKSAGNGKAKSSGAKTDKPAKPSDGKSKSAGKGRKRGFIAAALLFLVAFSGGAGVWINNHYGPGKSIAALRDQFSGLSAKVSSATSLSTKAQDQAAAMTGKLDAMTRELAALKEQNASLKKAIAALKTSAPKAAPQTAAALAELKKQTAAMAGIVNANAKGLAGTRQKLASLEGRFKALSASLEKAAKSGAASPAAQAASASLKLEETRQAIAVLKTRLDKLEKGLDARIAKAAAAGGAANGLKGSLEEQKTALSGLKQQMTAALDALKGQTGKAASTAAAALAAVTALKKNPPKPVIAPPPAGVAFAALRGKAQAGEPFAAELEKLKPYVPVDTGLSELEPIAAQGAPTRAGLEKRLAALAGKYESERNKSIKAQGKSGLMGALKARLSKVVKVRKTDEADWAGALTKAQKQIKTSLTAAIATLESQPGGMPADVAAWVKDARRRMITDKALNDLGEYVLSLVAAQSAGKAK